MPPSYAAQTLLIEGADALAFAQAQFSSDLRTLEVGHWQWSAWLDARGYVRALFHLARPAADTLLVLLRGGEAATMAQELQRFVFRSKVRLTAHVPRTLGTGPACDLYTLHSTNDVSIFDSTLLLGCGEHSLIVGADADDTWRLPHIRAGWPWLPAQVQERPPALSLERLGAVAFDKGCYPGQEVAARLHYRGGHKRHLYRVIFPQVSAPGSVLHHKGQQIAQLLDVMLEETDNHAQALAVIGDNALPQPANEAPLHTDEGLAMRIATAWPA